MVRPSLRGKEARQKSASAPRTRRGCVLRLPLAWVLGDPHGPLAHDAPASQSFPKNINLSRTAEAAADERSEDNGLVEAGVKTDVRKRDEPGSSRKKPLKRLRAIVSNWPALEVDAVTGSESSRQFGMKRLRDAPPGASTLGKVLNGVRSQRVIVPAAADEPIYLVGKRIERRLAAARFQPVEDTLFTRCPRSPGYNTRPDRERLVKNQLFDRALPAITLQHIADDGFIDAVLGRRNRPSIASRLRRVAGVSRTSAVATDALNAIRFMRPWTPLGSEMCPCSLCRLTGMSLRRPSGPGSRRLAEWPALAELLEFLLPRSRPVAPALRSLGQRFPSATNSIALWFPRAFPSSKILIFRR